MHRIPYGLTSGASANRPAVYLQHGLLGSSADWLVNGPQQSFAYLLADAGYDLWMGNVRGSTHSRQHITLSPDSKEFWHFSWHESGYYDLPAMIDYVSTTTGQPKIQYVGHSQGTTTFLVMASMRPEYNDKILSAHMLSPVAFMSHLTSPFVKAIVPFVFQLETVAQLLGINEFLPSTQMSQAGGYFACRDQSPIQELCANNLFLIFGYNSKQLNRTILPDIYANIPGGASVRQFLHYAQEVNSGKFRQYDELGGNWLKYGSVTPPEYPLEEIRCPIALYHSGNDWVSSPIDVEQLASRLSSMIGNYPVLDPQFNHLDYVYAWGAKAAVYDKVMEVMSDYAA